MYRWILLSLALLAPLPASALSTFEMKGTLTEVEFSGGGSPPEFDPTGVAVGTPFTVLISYDLNAPLIRQISDPIIDEFSYPMEEIFIFLGNNAIVFKDSEDSLILRVIDVAEGLPIPDQYFFDAFEQENSDGTESTRRNFGIDLITNDNEFLESNRPPEMLDYSDVSGTFFELSIELRRNRSTIFGVEVFGEIESIADVSERDAVVPLPPSLLLLASSLIFLRARFGRAG
ncbi:MAG: hypothetical protein AAF192_13795 [Pseudomonadota bacterium]